jgi:hypothetical protein
VGKGGDPLGECPRRLDVGSESEAQRTEHFKYTNYFLT